MEYPGTKLTKPIRQAIFVFFLLLFFIVSPIIIMYTSGYRYDFKNGLLRETGSVNIDILPTSAEAYLNNSKLKSKIPIRLNNLIAGKFLLTLKNPGYFDWQKNIEVVNKETVYIKDIVMIKKNTPQILNDGEIEDLSISTDKKFLIYSLKKNDTKEIWQKNIKTGENILLKTSFPNKPLMISFSSNGNYYLVSTQEKPYKQIIIVETQKPDKIIELSDYSKTDILKYQWKDGYSSELYYATPKQIMIFFPETQSQLFVAKIDFIDWYMDGEKMWIIRNNTSTKKMEIIKDALGFGSVFFEEPENLIDAWEILTIKNDLLLLKQLNQAKMLILTQDKKYNISGEKFFISKYNNWLVIWTSWEIWTKTQNEEPVLLNRSGLQLQQVLTLDKYNTLGLVWAENTTVLFPYYLVSHELLSQKINTAISDSDNRILYFGGKYENKEGLWKLEY